MDWSKYRNYEMSVWTLQDNYITTLKSADPLTIISSNESSLPARAWSQARAQGQVQNGEMTINIDGTQTLTFDIPMYLYKDGKRIENPGWYSTIDLDFGANQLDKTNWSSVTNRNVLTSMRKIKVIFNKPNAQLIEDKNLKQTIVLFFSEANGNVDLYHRPIVNNADGSYSTLVTTTYTIGNMIVNLTAIKADGTPLYTLVPGVNGYTWDLTALNEYAATLAAGNPADIDALLALDTDGLVIRAVTADATHTTKTEQEWAKRLQTLSDIYEKQFRSQNVDMTITNVEDENEPTVFEFIITKVQEQHEKDDLMCHVECEGLAFHELGKVGYKRTLSPDEFNNEYYDWVSLSDEEKKTKEKPIANLQYWMGKANISSLPKKKVNGVAAIDLDKVNPTKWYYDIRMAHTSMVHKQIMYSDKIYEEGYATDWNTNGNPISYAETCEKARMVDISESNLYNITQEVAEKFGVFCRYEYLYDANYNIIGRVIVFFNNFLQEDKVVTLMYPNSASKISREMDSTDVSTKMFVRSVEDSDIYSSMLTIMDCAANYAREDYIMNFDYLHDIGTITDEQYEAITNYNKTIRQLNDQLTPLQGAYNRLSDMKIEVDAMVTTLTNSIDLDSERITDSVEKINALTSSDGSVDGYITRDWRNPQEFTLIKDSSHTDYDSYYIQFNDNTRTTGIVPQTLKLYQNYNTTSTKKITYGISFHAFNENSLKNRTVSQGKFKVPGYHDNKTICIWRNIKPVLKGTIGIKGTVDKLPSEPSQNDAYKAIVDGAAQGYVNRDKWVAQYAKVDEWLVYKEDTNTGKYRWEIKEKTTNNTVPSGYTDKGTIGKKNATVKTLPSNAVKKDAYRVITKKYISGYVNSHTQEYQLTNVKNNEWLCYVSVGDTSDWRWEIKSSKPSDAHDKGTISLPVDVNADGLPAYADDEDHDNRGWIYQVVGNCNVTLNGTSTAVTKGSLIICDEKAKLWKVYDAGAHDEYYKNGFYLYTKEQVSEIAGPTIQQVKCSRLGTHGSGLQDYISLARFLYYTTAENTAPSVPTVESATEKATTIYNNNIIDKWSSYLSIPDAPVTETPNTESYLQNYTFYAVMQLIYAQGKKSFHNRHATTQDITGTAIITAVNNASSDYLTKELNGNFKYNDETGVLEKVTDIFTTAKSGNYVTYGQISKPWKLNSSSTMSDIGKGLATLKHGSKMSTMPAVKKNVYIIIHTTHYHSNGNVTHSYKLKYYDKDGLEATPTYSSGNVPKHYVKTITPVFFLRTKDFRYADIGVPTSENVVSSAVTNKWTTVLPTKTKDSETYYYGWYVTYYGSTPATYHGKKKSTKLKKQSTMANDYDDPTTIPSYIYGTYKYKPSWYYEEIKSSYEKKLDADTQNLSVYQEKQQRINTLQSEVDNNIQSLTSKKEITISGFEHMMGAALRESYWQPENEYYDYGTRYNEKLDLKWAFDESQARGWAETPTPAHTATQEEQAAELANLAKFDIVSWNNTKDSQFASIGWGYFDDNDEEKVYYESSINQTKTYYHCLDLSKITKDNGASYFLDLYKAWLNTSYATESNTTKGTSEWEVTKDANGNITSYVDSIILPENQDLDEYAESLPITINNDVDENSTDTGDTTTYTFPTSSTSENIDAMGKITSIAEREFFAFFFNPSTQTIPADGNYNDVRYMKYYTIGSGAQLAFFYDALTSKKVKPILILKDASSLGTTEEENLMRSGKIGKIQVRNVDSTTNTGSETHNILLSYTDDNVYEITQSMYLTEEELEAGKLVYPRILIPSLKLKTNTKDLVIKYGETELKQYEDYSVFVRSFFDMRKQDSSGVDSREAGYNKDTAYTTTFSKTLEMLTLDELSNYSNYNTVYAVTLNPKVLHKFTTLSDIYKNLATSIQFNTYYMLSNADMDIYLDGKNILKENAYPKVSYEIEVSMWSRDLLANLYKKLAQLVMINDTDLKFQNTFGYISQITLDLDHQERDRVEVKNYKTKFEDLFSSIVAQTEEMHKNAYNLGLASQAAASETVTNPLSTESFGATITNPTNQQLLLAFLSEYFDGPEVVQNTLKGVWDEAGEIMNAAAQGLGASVQLTRENATILAGFKENVAAAMTPTVFSGETPPSKFKSGDVWINGDYRAVATGSSDYGGGFTRTYDGSLSAITGPSMEIDAVTGDINILSATQINLMSGKNIYIAANDTVDIVGNKEVNIGGTTINMASAQVTGEGYTGINGAGGIHLVSTEYNYTTTVVTSNEGSETIGQLEENGISRVDINGTGIELASKKGIIIKSGEGIKVYASNQDVDGEADATHGTAAVNINSTDGIWIGSNRSLTLFSGDIILDDDGTVIGGSTGANAEFNSDHILFGMVNLAEDTGTALEMTDKQLILAAGKELNTLEIDDDGNYILNEITESSIAGVQIKSDYIGMATGDNNNRSLLSLKPKKVMIAQVSQQDGYKFVESIEDQNTWDTNKKYFIEESDGEYYTKYFYEDNEWKSTPHVGPEAFEGSFVWLSNSNVYIGAMSDFTINTNNIKIQTKYIKDGNTVGRIPDTTTESTIINNADWISKMGFVLGKNLQGPNPKPAFGFWMDTANNTHLIVDADVIKLGKNGNIHNIAMDQDIFESSKTLYAITNDNVNYPACPAYTQGGNDTWGQDHNVSILTLAGNIWSETIPVPQGAAKYVWRMTEVKYKDPGIYRCSTPVFDGATDERDTTVYRQYTYSTYDQDIESAPDVSWSRTLPSPPTGSTILYGTQACTPGPATGSNPTLFDGDNVSQWVIKSIPLGSRQVIVYHTINVADNENMETYSLDTTKQNYALRTAENAYSDNNTISTAGAWKIILEDELVKQVDDTKYLWSRRVTHYNIYDTTVSPTQYDIYDDYKRESELQSISAAGVTAIQMSQGSYPVPAVASSGLIVEGDKVLLGSTGKLMLLGNAEVILGTSSSNSGLVLNKDGISIGSGKDIAIASGGKLEMFAGTTRDTDLTFKMDPTGYSYTVNSTTYHTSLIEMAGGSIQLNTINDDTYIHLKPDQGIQMKAGSFHLYTSDPNAYLHFDSNNFKIQAKQSTHFQIAPESDLNGGISGFSMELRTDSNTYLRMTPNSVNLHLNSNNYMQLDSSGFNFKGKRIKMNGKEIWARDDIIIMNPNIDSQDEEAWRQTVKKIENHMKVGQANAQHDWVLIRPYYDSELNYTGSGCTADTTYTLSPSSTKGSFGDSASWYQYDIEFDLGAVSGDSNFPDNNRLKIKLSSDSSLSNSHTVTMEIPKPANVNYIGTTSVPAHISLSSGHVSINLCDDDGMLYFRLVNTLSGAVPQANNISLKCTCAATSNRVPCTVYYYP